MVCGVRGANFGGELVDVLIEGFVIAIVFYLKTRAELVRWFWYGK